MTAGLPGLGLGGVFYLLCGLVMPLAELLRRATGRARTPWRAVLAQAALAWGVVLSIWLAGWLLGALPLATVAPAGATGGDAGAAEVAELYGAPSALAGLLTLAVLAVVLVGVQVLRLVAAPPAPAPAATGHAGRGTPGGST